MRPLFILLFVLLLSCQSKQTPNKDLERWQKQAQAVTIIRDDFGVPHIYGKTDADAVFGLLYAQCEDDFNRVEQNYIWAIGRLAEVEGKAALYSDVRANLFMTKNEAITAYESAPKWLRKLCIAFADGINYYLHTHPQVRPKLITHFEPWMPMYFTEGSIGGDIERIATKKIAAFYKNTPKVHPLEAMPKQLPKVAAEPQGSNGIAIAGKLTKNGHPLLLINPHTSFYFRGEVHMVSQEGLNAYGAVTWGQFFVYQGFNENTGWMHTSTYTDVIDEYKETLVKKDNRLFYVYGEELRPVDSLKINLRFATDNEFGTKAFTLYRTHHGPITHMVDNQWTATALMWKPVEALTQSYIRTKQNGYKGFREMMDMRTNSSNNTVYADAQGNIAYFHGNFIPKRDTIFDFTKPLNGTNPATDWGKPHPVDECITLLNPANGWLQNCNSTPFTAAANYSPKQGNYPKYMSRNQENFRGVHAINLLENGNNFTLDGLLTLAHDPYLPAFKVLLPGLIDAYDRHDRTKYLGAAIEELRQWDYKTGVQSTAMTLAHYYGETLLYNATRPKGLRGMALYDYWGNAMSAQEKLNHFKTAMQKLEADFGHWRQSWGKVNRYQRLNGDITQAFNDSLPSTAVGFASGRWGALAAYGARYHNNTKKIYGTRGNSFAAVVEFGPRVTAKSILVGGQSGDPNSKHFKDQVAPFTQANWKNVHFYKEDVLQHAVKTYQPGR